MTICAITPTGMRPEGLALLGEYLSAQDYAGPLRWIVVDDCDPATRLPKVRSNIEVEYIRPAWRWMLGQNTQAACLALALDSVPPGASVAIFEDDDVYLPGHLTNILAALEKSELVGERVAQYYNIASRRYRRLPSARHASLASVGLRGEAVKALRAIVRRISKPIDLTLWQEFAGPKELLDSANVIGIKGLPGRPGVGIGHRLNFGSPDRSGVLEQWVGAYAANYDIFRRKAA